MNKIDYMQNIKLGKTQITKTGSIGTGGFITYINTVKRNRKLIGYITACSNINEEPTRFEVRDPSLHIHDIVDTKEEALELVAQLSIERPYGWLE